MSTTTQVKQYQGLEIHSHPTWYPDKNAWGAQGYIKGLPIGNKGNQNLLFNSSITFCTTEDKSHQEFFKFAEKFISDNRLP